MSELLNKIANDSTVNFFQTQRCHYDWNDFTTIYKENCLSGDFTVSAMLATKLMSPYIRTRKFIPAGRSRDDEIEDYIQDVYFEILRAMNNYDPSLSSFPQYIQKTICGVAATHARGGISKYQKDHHLSCEISQSFDAKVSNHSEQGEAKTFGEICEGDNMDSILQRQTRDHKEEIYSRLALDKKVRERQDNFEIVALNKLLGGYEEWNYKIQERFFKKVHQYEITFEKPDDNGAFLDDYSNVGV